MWRYTGLTDLLNIIKATVLSSMTIITAHTFFNQFEDYPHSIFVTNAILAILAVSGFRIGIRLLTEAKGNPLVVIRRGGHQKGQRLLIIGAGDAGEKMVREILDNGRLEYNVIGFLLMMIPISFIDLYMACRSLGKGRK